VCCPSGLVANGEGAAAIIFERAVRCLVLCVHLADTRARPRITQLMESTASSDALAARVFEEVLRRTSRFGASSPVRLAEGSSSLAESSTRLSQSPADAGAPRTGSVAGSLHSTY
jgi:hypothetical protein